MLELAPKYRQFLSQERRLLCRLLQHSPLPPPRPARLCLMCFSQQPYMVNRKGTPILQMRKRESSGYKQSCFYNPSLLPSIYSTSHPILHPDLEAANPKIRLYKISGAMLYARNWELYIKMLFSHMVHSPKNSSQTY